jgi:hypothetical protein
MNNFEKLCASSTPGELKLGVHATVRSESSQMLNCRDNNLPLEHATPNAARLALSWGSTPKLVEKLSYLLRFPLAMNNPGFRQEVEALLNDIEKKAGEL